jgi:DNA mismatch endonuclease (patch repair protein)
MERRLRLKLPQGKFLNVSATRSRMMSAIRAKNTRSTERALRSALMRAGIKGWQLHPDHLLGKPDVYFPKHGLAIFVDGCFWHFCPRCGHIPRTRQPFWKAKIERNRQRDQRTRRSLTRTGINVIRIWEHELRSEANTARVINKIRKKLSSVVRTQWSQQNDHRKI